MITGFSKDLITKALRAGKTVCVYVPSESLVEPVRKRVNPGDEYQGLFSVVALSEIRGYANEPPLIVIDEYVPTLAEDYDYEGVEREFGYDGDALR